MYSYNQLKLQNFSKLVIFSGFTKMKQGEVATPLLEKKKHVLVR